MKIGILINSFNLGGAEKLMYDVADVMHRRGIPFTLISMKKAGTELEHQIFENLADKGYEIVSVDKPVGSGRFKALLSIRKIIKKYNIDVLHTNGQSPDFYGRLSKLLSPKTKVVVTIHNTGGYSRRIEQLLSPLTSAYTAVSKQAKEYGINELNIKKEISVINDGIDFERYEKHNKKNSEEYMILSVGRIMPQKAYLSVVESVCEYLKINKNAVWSIVGDTTQDEEYVSAVKSEIPAEVSDRVKFHGTVTNPEEYYKNAQVFLLPSSYEGFGIVFIEAMAAKLPVICNEVGVILDIKRDGGHIVELKDKSISECIDEVKSIKEEWIEHNYKLCKDKFSIEATVDEYMRIYKNSLGDASRR